MTTRPRALAYALAVLALTAVIGLGLRLSGQWNDLQTARADLADATRTADQLRRTVAAGVGPALLDASVAPPPDQLGQRLKDLGVAVRVVKLVAETPAGGGTVAARFTANGQADAAALDRLALWAQANARSAILEQLTATAGVDGKSDVTIELDAIVHTPGVRRS